MARRAQPVVEEAIEPMCDGVIVDQLAFKMRLATLGAGQDEPVRGAHRQRCIIASVTPGETECRRRSRRNAWLVGEIRSPLPAARTEGNEKPSRCQ